MWLVCCVGSRSPPGIGRVSGHVARFRWVRRVVAVSAVKANTTRAQLFRQYWAQLQCWAQLHVHRRRQVLFCEEGQAGAVYSLLLEVLQTNICLLSKIVAVIHNCANGLIDISYLETRRNLTTKQLKRENLMVNATKSFNLHVPNDFGSKQRILPAMLSYYTI